MKSIYGITRSKLEEYFANKGDKKFRATQIFEWVYRKRAKSFDEMSNIKKETIDKENHYLIDLNTNLFDDFLEAWIQKKPI